MGIQNLLPFLERSTTLTHLSEFRGKTLAVDSYCLLYRGAYGCAEKLGMDIDTDQYIYYCIKYVNMLVSYKIKPIMVFDGKTLPAKNLTEIRRSVNKRNARSMASQMMKVGNKKEAHKYLAQSINITPEMAVKLIKLCQKRSIDCIVAPFEADAQLAYLNLNGYADAVVTEDSDLMVFGAKKVLYKLDLQGNAKLVHGDLIYRSMDMTEEEYTLDKFRYICILSGCDYVNSLSGIGLKTARKFIRTTSDDDPIKFLDRIPQKLRKPNVAYHEAYRKNFLVANKTFKYQIVYDPMTRRELPLNQIVDDDDRCSNAGSEIDEEIAFQIAIGNFNPYTYNKINDWEPTSSPNSIWSRSYKKINWAEKTPVRDTVAGQASKSNVLQNAPNEYDDDIGKQLEKYRANQQKKDRVETQTRDRSVEEREKNRAGPSGLVPSSSSNKPQSSKTGGNTALKKDETRKDASTGYLICSCQSNSNQQNNGLWDSGIVVHVPDDIDFKDLCECKQVYRCAKIILDKIDEEKRRLKALENFAKRYKRSSTSSNEDGLQLMNVSEHEENYDESDKEMGDRSAKKRPLGVSRKNQKSPVLRSFAERCPILAKRNRQAMEASNNQCESRFFKNISNNIENKNESMKENNLSVSRGENSSMVPSTSKGPAPEESRKKKSPYKRLPLNNQPRITDFFKRCN